MTEEIRTFKTQRSGLGIIFKWVFILFNLAMVLWLFSYWLKVGPLLDSGSNAERAGATIGTTIGTAYILLTWIPGVIILGIPVLLTKGKIVEVKKTQNTKSSSSSAAIIFFILMLIIIFVVSNPTPEKTKPSNKITKSVITETFQRPISEYNISSYSEPSREMKDAALEAFKEDPNQIIDMISLYVDKKNWWMVRNKTETLLETDDSNIIEWHRIALENLEKEKVNVASTENASSYKLQQHKQSNDEEGQVKKLTDHHHANNQRPQNWSISYSSSPMDDSKTISATTTAIKTVDTWLDEVTPLLNIRCKENKTDLIFISDTYFNSVYGRYSEAKIRYRIDENKPITEYWTESTDNKAVFSKNPIATLRKIADANVLLVEFTPHNSNQVTTEFNISGLRPLLKEIADTCNWKL